MLRLSGMGIEKPYEAEIHTLGPAPLPHAPFDLRAHLAELIVPRGRDAIAIAGREVRVGPHERPDDAAEELRALIRDRMLARRPDADACTWEWLVRVLHGELADGAALDDELRRELIRSVDGL